MINAPEAPHATVIGQGMEPPPGTIAPQLLEATPAAPVAEPGTQTSEFKLVAATTGLIVSATGLFDALAAAGALHVDPTLVGQVNGASAALVTFLSSSYAVARSIRKAGTSG